MLKKKKEPKESAPKDAALIVVRGYALRPKVGGGRVPMLVCVANPPMGDALTAIKEKLNEVSASREMKWEALEEPLDWGSTAKEGVRFFIGHGVSMWDKKVLEERWGLA